MRGFRLSNHGKCSYICSAFEIDVYTSTEKYTMKLQIFASVLLTLVLLAGCENGKKTEKKDPAVNTETAPKTDPTAGVYAVNVESSKIEWTGTKDEDGDKDVHKGELSLKEGSLKVDAEGRLVSGDFSVDMLSLVNTDLSEKMKGDFEKHLKSADFFEVEKYTTATFSMTSVTPKETKGQYAVKGSLAVKDITTDLSFDVSVDISGNEMKGQSEIQLTNEDLGLAPFPAQIDLKVGLVAMKK